MAIDPLFKNQLLYPLEDPETAFDNAMRDSGYNPYAQNPFMNVMKRAAPGLGVTYASDMALTGMYGNPDGKPGMNDFGTYLRNAIQGVPGESIASRLGGHANSGGLRSTVNLVRNYRDLQGQGNATADFNPYVAYLSDLYGQNEGKGLADAMLAVRAPLLGTNLARSYRTGLDQSFSGAYRNLVNSGDMNSDIWRYLVNF